MILLGDYQFSCLGCIHKQRAEFCTHPTYMEERGVSVVSIEQNTRRNGQPLESSPPGRFMLTKAVVDPELNARCFENKCFSKNHYKFQCFQLRCRAKFENPVTDVYLDIFKSKKVPINDEAQQTSDGDDSNLVHRTYREYVKDFQKRKSCIDELNEKETVRFLQQKTSKDSSALKAYDYFSMDEINNRQERSTPKPFSYAMVSALESEITAMYKKAVCGDDPKIKENLLKDCEAVADPANPIDVIIDQSTVQEPVAVKETTLEFDCDFDGLDFNYKTINRAKNTMQFQEQAQTESASLEKAPPTSSSESDNVGDSASSSNDDEELKSTKFEQLFRELYKDDSDYWFLKFPESQDNCSQDEMFGFYNDLKFFTPRSEDYNVVRTTFLKPNSHEVDYSVGTSDARPLKATISSNSASNQKKEESTQEYHLDSVRKLEGEPVEFFFDHIFKAPEAAASRDGPSLIDSYKSGLLTQYMPSYDDGDGSSDEESEDESSEIEYTASIDIGGYLEGLTLESSARYSSF
ncbi:hypothetical protein WICPIJ_007869 [Wickerhamomyces pijperi]|uniref:Copper-fist domain-containing protein n=1 Tax=Wickerhamomyces pijperi TaxID=599730 RepID=A0A9P8Q1L7_WICPI|nr:hypothetical protein WICPIJ_007869 [Wickerhamomyces pijperi]